MEPRAGESVCVVARLTNRVSLHFEAICVYITKTQQPFNRFSFIPFLSLSFSFPFVMKTL